MCYIFVQTFTGDTLTTSQSTARAAAKAWRRDQQRRGKHQQEDGLQEVEQEEDAAFPVLAGVNVPAPVFFCSIEPPSVAYQKHLEHALECLQKEDPSLKVVYMQIDSRLPFFLTSTIIISTRVPSL